MNALTHPTTTEDFRAKAALFHQEAAEIVNAAAAQRRELTIGEKKIVDGSEQAFNAAMADAERAEAAGGSIPPAPLKVGTAVFAERNRSASESFAGADDFVRAVARSPRNALDPRLIKAAVTTYGSEGANSDGGYAVPPDFRVGIQRLLNGPDSIFPLFDPLTTTTSTITVPTDEDPPWSATGLVASQIAEGAAPTASKPVVKQLSIPLTKYDALVYATEELVADGSGFGSFVLEKAASKLAWKLNVAAYQALTTTTGRLTIPKGATGVGASPSLLNLQAMWAAFAPPFRHDAVWLANPTLEADLEAYQLGNWPVYLSAGVGGNLYPTIRGRRVIFSEVCAAKGTEGDLLLFSPSMVYGASRVDSPSGSMSMHLAFDQDLLAYKAILRACVRPKFSSTITRPDSSTTAPYITCQTR